MPGLRGLTVILATAEPPRVDAAGALAAASAALGAPTRLYLHGDAVRALDDPRVGIAIELGALVIACQTGLADAGIDLDTADPRIAAGGMVSLLAELGDDRLVTL